MVLDIYFVRHAESELNVHSHTIGGRSTWAELTDNGVKQARALGERLRDMNFKTVYSSPAVRAQQTARHCLEAMHCFPGGDVHIRTDLSEQSAGDWTGMNRNYVYSLLEVKAGFAEDGWNYVPGFRDKGESQAEVAARMHKWLAYTWGENAAEGRVLAFTHGNAIKYFLAEIEDSDRQKAYLRPIDNASISIVRLDGPKRTILRENDISHIVDAGLELAPCVFDRRSLE